MKTRLILECTVHTIWRLRKGQTDLMVKFVRCYRSVVFLSIWVFCIFYTWSSLMKSFLTAVLNVVAYRFLSTSLTIRAPYTKSHSCCHNHNKSCVLHPTFSDSVKFLKCNVNHSWQSMAYELYDLTHIPQCYENFGLFCSSKSICCQFNMFSAFV